jgi:hypothetical protein
VKRGICLPCNAASLDAEELLIQIAHLQAKLEKEKHLKRLLEWQLKNAKIKISRMKKKP